MAKRLFVLLLFLFIYTPSWPQSEVEDFDGPHIDILIGAGRYREAYDFVNTGIQKLKAKQIVSATYYAGFGKLFIEVGMPKDAGKALKIADSASSRTGESNHFVAREMTAYLLAQGDYSNAVKWAVNAVRETSYRKVRDVVNAYCQSLEAIARLRTGDVALAEKLIRSALRDAPMGTNLDPVFGPRVYYHACIIESHRANYQEALQLCRLGLEIAESKKLENRDLPLGYLALAESYFLSGDAAHCRENAEKAIASTEKIFHANHQDTVTAFQLLARLDQNEGKKSEAQAHAKSALEIAEAIFEPNSNLVKSVKQTLVEASK